MKYKFRYALKLSEDVKMLMSTLRTNNGVIARAVLFNRVNNEWVMLNKPTDCRIEVRNYQYYFRKRLPKNFKHLHSELFYLDDFVEIQH